MLHLMNKIWIKIKTILVNHQEVNCLYFIDTLVILRSVIKMKKSSLFKAAIIEHKANTCFIIT